MVWLLVELWSHRASCGDLVAEQLQQQLGASVARRLHGAAEEVDLGSKKPTGNSIGNP